jgi:NTE family protein
VFRVRFPVYDDNDRLGDVALTGLSVGADLGRELGNWGELRVGARWVDARGKPVIGLDELSSVTQRGGGAFVRFATDTFDHPSFPTSGQLTRTSFSKLWGAFGTSTDLDLFRFEGWKALSFGENTVNFGFEGATTFDGATNLYDLVRVGGFLRLSGLDRDQLSGRYAGVGRIVGYRKIATPGILSFTYPLYIGASLEYGGAWMSGSDISWSSGLAAGSVFLGLDSPIGPIYLAYGLSEGGRDAAYFFIGQIF